MDDSKSVHEKWLFHQTSIKNWLFLGFQVDIIYCSYPKENCGNPVEFVARAKYRIYVLAVAEVTVSVLFRDTIDNPDRNLQFWLVVSTIWKILVKSSPQVRVKTKKLKPPPTQYSSAFWHDVVINYPFVAWTYPVHSWLKSQCRPGHPTNGCW